MHIRFAAAFALGLSLVAAGGTWPGRVGALSAQEPSPCALLTDDDVKQLVASDAAGISDSLPSYGYNTCRYAWGNGVDRFKLVVSVTEASRMFPGLTPDQIKQRLLGSIREGTNDAVIPEVGDAAVFKPDSYVYAVGTAFVKGRILQVYLDGLGARDRKDQVAGVLKSAAAKL